MATRLPQTRESGPALAALRDLTATDQWKHAQDWFMQLHGPNLGHVSNAEHLNASPDGTKIAFTASIWKKLDDGKPIQRVYVVNLDGSLAAAIQCVTHGPNTDKMPRWAPDGKTLAFLSDRARIGHFTLYELDFERLNDPRPLTPDLHDGVIDHFEWSAAGDSLLFRLAPYGLPVSGVEGSGTLAGSSFVSTSTWKPIVWADTPQHQNCSLWWCDVRSGETRRVSGMDRNVWTFCWAGPSNAVALVSGSSEEAQHRESSVVRICLSSGSEMTLRAKNHLMVGQLACTASGSHVALVESVGSERVKIVGNLAVIDVTTQEKIVQPTNDVDVGSIAWIGENRLMAMGLRNMDSVALEVNTATQEVRELWSTTDACGNLAGFAAATWVPNGGFAVVRNSWRLAPEIGRVNTNGHYGRVVSFDHNGATWLRGQTGNLRRMTWTSTDGLDIHGLLYLPIKGTAPYKLIVNIHGGPFSSFTDKWLGYGVNVPWLNAHGYAVFCPNPRGSVGRGAKFASAVKGDIGGMDAHDILSGVDQLVADGVADSKRLGVMGGSYGGYMTAWLITQTIRFAAAIPSFPVADYKLQWLCGDSRQPILGDEIYVENSLAHRRSPLTHIQHCRTPTLLFAGARDSCTPPAHAQYLHKALSDLGVASVYVEYPQEGHGVRQFPAIYDTCCRMLDWFKANI